MTHAPADFPASGEYFSQPDALGSFDGETDYDAPPMVYIARADGAALRAACQAGAVDATVNADIRVRLEEDGGFGYNVVGKIPGTVNPSQMVVVSSHHDAWFKGVMDDTSAIATALTMAKAMRTSGTRPTKTLVFLVTTGEEFGTTNSWYDWLIGAYHFIDKAHPDWVGRIAGQINLEWQGLKDAPFQVRANPEMAPYVQGVLDGNPALVPYGVDNGGKVRPNAWTWNDQWPFTAKGVPSVYFVAKDAAYRGQWYHTQYDDLSLIDWDYLGKAAKLFRLVHKGLDEGLLPYDFNARADALAASAGIADPSELVAAGIDAESVAWFSARVARFTRAAATFQARRAAINPGQYGLVNARLMVAEKTLNGNLTALDMWDGACYPQEQVLWDLQNLNATLAALESEPANIDAALAALYNVGPFFYGDMFGKEVYQRQLVRQSWDYYRLNWGSLGHLSPYVDVYDAYHAIEAGQIDEAIAMLSPERREMLYELDYRLYDVGWALNAAASTLRGVTPIAAPIR